MVTLDLSNDKLVFDGEFNSISLVSPSNPNGVWVTTYWGGGRSQPSNAEKEFYIDPSYDNLGVTPFTTQNGILSITASATPAALLSKVNNYPYLSGMLTTDGTFSQTYGVFEMRAELPAGKGFWPAFWMMSSAHVWPPEIDVMEMLGNQTTTDYTSVHTGPSNTDFTQGNTVPNTTTGFHTYAVDWEPATITFYFDGQAVFSTATPSDMHGPMYMLANFAVGGYWPGYPDSTTPLPAAMQIQWIKAYASPNSIPNQDTAPVSGQASAAQAVANYQAGAVGGPVPVADSAANVFSHLDGLQTLATAGDLGTVSLTDTNAPSLSITTAQLAADYAALKAISGNFALTETASGSSEIITGLTGHANTVQFAGNASQYTLVPVGDGAGLTVTSGAMTDQVKGVTALQFADLTDIVASQTPPVAGAISSAQVTELYGAVLGRTPDVAGLSFYENAAATSPSTPFLQYALWFLTSPEYTGNKAHAYAQGVTGDQQFITDSYTNLLHRAPSVSEVTFYEANVIAPALNGLTPGTTAYTTAKLQAHAQTLVYFSQSPEFLANVSVTATTPSSASHWLVLV